MTAITALLCAIPLRDGCDVLDVIGRRLRARLRAMPSDGLVMEICGA